MTQALDRPNSPCELSTHSAEDRQGQQGRRKEQAGPVLRLAVRGKLEDPRAVRAAVSGLIAIAGNMREAYAAVEQGSDDARSRAPYRGEPDAALARAAAAAREAEIARLHRLQRKRGASDRFLPVLAVVVFFFFLGLMIAR